MGYSSRCLDELLAKRLGSFSWGYRLYKLCSSSCGKTTIRYTIHPENYWTCIIFWVIQRSGRTRSLGDCQTRLEALDSDLIGV